MALDCNIVWLTTWNDENGSNEWIGPLFGWTARDFILENPRPFIWADDDLDDAIKMREVEWLSEIEEPWVTICPNISLGLTPVEINSMELFLDATLDYQRRY